MDPSHFLIKFVPGYGDLSDEERIAISNFTLLWSAMEGRVLDTHANPASLLSAVNAMARQGLLHMGAFEASLQYFRDRYFRSGEFTDHFANLFRESDRRPIVEAVLSGNDDDLEHVVGVLLLITYRLRNNLFHGVKWAYGIRGQRTNFLHASDVMMRILELHKV